MVRVIHFLLNLIFSLAYDQWFEDNPQVGDFIQSTKEYYEDFQEVFDETREIAEGIFEETQEVFDETRDIVEQGTFLLAPSILCQDEFLQFLSILLSSY